MISILCCTYRIGGIDVLLNMLGFQTLPTSDFEVILVDELFEHRKEIVSKLAEERRLNCQHLPPEYQGDWGIPHHWNQALRHAKGDLIITLDDYCFGPARWLQLHDEFHKEHLDGLILGCGPTHDMSVPPLKWPPPLMVGKESRVPLEEALYTVFRKEHPYCLVDSQLMRRDGGKPVEQFKPFMPPHWSYGNIAIPRRILEELNGWDEEYSGSHGFWDNDLSYRFHKYGCRVIYLDSNPAYHFYHEDGTFEYDHMGMKTLYFNRRLREIGTGDIRPKRGAFENIEEVQTVRKF